MEFIFKLIKKRVASPPKGSFVFKKTLSSRRRGQGFYAKAFFSSQASPGNAWLMFVLKVPENIKYKYNMNPTLSPRGVASSFAQPESRPRVKPSASPLTFPTLLPQPVA
jgi:hypothetical protein